jgi:hypothetical protein
VFVATEVRWGERSGPGGRVRVAKGGNVGAALASRSASKLPALWSAFARHLASLRRVGASSPAGSGTANMDEGHAMPSAGVQHRRRVPPPRRSFHDPGLLSSRAAHTGATVRSTVRGELALAAGTLDASVDATDRATRARRGAGVARVLTAGNGSYVLPALRQPRLPRSYLIDRSGSRRVRFGVGPERDRRAPTR